MNTSDGLGICRKREEGEKNEAASVGREHYGLENLRKGKDLWSDLHRDYERRSMCSNQTTESKDALRRRTLGAVSTGLLDVEDRCRKQENRFCIEIT